MSVSNLTYCTVRNYTEIKTVHPVTLLCSDGSVIISTLVVNQKSIASTF